MSGQTAVSSAWRRRTVRRRSDARLTTRQVRAVYELYADGHSIPWIADRLWCRFGFANSKTCQTQLYAALKRDGFESRSLSVASTLRHSVRGCIGCGCAMDRRTRGCQRCICRHNRRKTSGLPYVTAPKFEGCAGCGCPLDQRTRGCRTCISRVKQRRQRAKRQLAVAA